MIIGKLVLPYNDFKIGDIIDSEEFDANNQTIVNTVNQIIELVNHVEDRVEGVVFPNYIKETYIDGVELRSPKITGNTLIGSNGMVGITSVGLTDDSVRIWSGNSDPNVAPFRVLQDGSVIMSKLNVNFGEEGISGITSNTPYPNSVIMWAGNEDKDIAPFRVTKDGSVSLSNVSVGTNGIVGLTSNAPTDNSVVMWAGNTNKNVAPFRVAKNGSVNLSSVKVGVDGIVGLISDALTNDSIVMWAGNENNAIAPFRVTKDGSVTMSNSNITGSFTTKNGEHGNYITLNNSLLKSYASDKTLYEIGGLFGKSEIPGIVNDTTTTYFNLYSNSYDGSVNKRSSFSINSNISRTRIGTSPGASIDIVPQGDYGTIPHDSSKDYVNIFSNLNVTKNLYLTGDIYVNGVKMKLTPA